MADFGAIPGAFGKIPTRADFFRCRLSATFVDPWDEWLGAAIVRSRSDLGPDWLDAYLTSPIWCFAFAAGVCGPAPVAGVLVPSVDAVNRHFPLTLASLLATDCRPFVIAIAASWYAALEDLALAALAERLEPASIADRLASIGLPPIASPSSYTPRLAIGAGTLVRSWAFDAETENCSPAVLYPGMLDDLAADSLGACSLWWTKGSDAIEPSIRLYRGLPKDGAFVAFLTGEQPEPDPQRGAGSSPVAALSLSPERRP